MIALAPTASAHPVHNGCNPPQVWAVAYAQQLVGPFAIEWQQVGPSPLVRVPILHLNPGDPMSGIVCIP